jgi:hypothetical protein
MNTLKNWLTSLGTVMSADVRREFHNGFKLISNRPYLDYDEKGRIYANKDKPFLFPISIKPVKETNVTDAIWAKGSISCADDICYEAMKTKANIEVKAHGYDVTLFEAMLEVARYEDTENYKYILFEHPIQRRKGQSGVILENTAAPPTATEALVVSLVPTNKELKYYIN